MTTVDHYAQGTPSYVELTSPDQQRGQGVLRAAVRLGVRGRRHGRGGCVRRRVGAGRLDRRDRGQMPQLGGHPAFWGVYLAVDDVDATAAKVVPAGGKVEGGPFDVMELGRMASIQDPTRRPGEPLAGRPSPSARCGSTSPAARSGTSSRSPGPADGDAVLQRRPRRRVGVDADGDRRRLHLPHGRGPAGRGRVPAADGWHPAALGGLLQRRRHRRDDGAGRSSSAAACSVAPWDVPGSAGWRWSATRRALSSRCSRTRQRNPRPDVPTGEHCPHDLRLVPPGSPALPRSRQWCSPSARSRPGRRRRRRPWAGSSTPSTPATQASRSSRPPTRSGRPTRSAHRG